MVDLTTSGIYTIAEAARLTNTSYQRIRGWVFGYRSDSQPILRNEIEDLNRSKALSFATLMEARFIAAFAERGIHVRTLRAIAEEARRMIEHPHPFTTLKFRTDGRKIFAEVEEKTGDPRLYDLRKRNWAMYSVMEQFLIEGVEYEANVARRWRPAKNVMLDPVVSFGHPVLERYGVRTSTLYDAWCVERSFESVAHWFDVPLELVRNAVRFETRLENAAA